MTKSLFKSKEIIEWDNVVKKNNINEFQICRNTQFIVNDEFYKFRRSGVVSLDGKFIKGFYII